MQLAHRVWQYMALLYFNTTNQTFPSPYSTKHVLHLCLAYSHMDPTTPVHCPPMLILHLPTTYNAFDKSAQEACVKVEKTCLTLTWNPNFRRGRK